MASLIRVSDAASLALHAMAVLAASSKFVSARAIAKTLRVSEAHLAKVMGRLERAGFIRGKRGPSGGFELARPSDRVTLSDIYEVMEGEIRARCCFLAHPACQRRCIFGSLLSEMDQRIRDHFARTRLSDVSVLFSGPALGPPPR